MSNRAINSENNTPNSSIFNCNEHGNVRSIHNRCPICYRNRMKDYSSGVRHRNIILRPINRNNSSRPTSVPNIETNINHENLFIERPNTQNNIFRRNFLPPIVEHPPIPPIPNNSLPNRNSNRRLFSINRNLHRRVNRLTDIGNMINVQRLLTENEIRNISLNDTQNKSVNLQVLTRDTNICSAPDNGACSICQEDWDEKEVVRKLPCNHVFHVMCIDRWFTKNNVCPVCRYEMSDS